MPFSKPLKKRSEMSSPSKFDASSFILQVKSEDWGGEFVDITDEQFLGDRQVISMVLKVSSNSFRC